MLNSVGNFIKWQGRKFAGDTANIMNAMPYLRPAQYFFRKKPLLGTASIFGTYVIGAAVRDNPILKAGAFIAHNLIMDKIVAYTKAHKNRPKGDMLVNFVKKRPVTSGILALTAAIAAGTYNRQSRAKPKDHTSELKKISS